MGDPWLQTLGQGGALAAAIGLIVWLFRYIVRREREISGQWRETAAQWKAIAEASMAAQERQDEALRRILASIESSNGTGRHHVGSWDGFSDYDAPRMRPPDSQQRH